MQKKLLGVAVAAALAAPAIAMAQSSVQVYGTVHMSVNSTRYSGDTAGNPSQRKWAVNSHSSNFGLRSTESLGGGLTAWFQAELGLMMERTNGVSNAQAVHRNSGVGLRGGWGNVYLGTWESPQAQTFRLWDVGTIGGYGPNTSLVGRRETTTSGVKWNCRNTLPGNSGSAAALTTTSICGEAADVPSSIYPTWRRMAASIHYESPVWSGVQAKLSIMPNENKSTFATNAVNAGTLANATTGINSNPSMWSGSLQWTGMGGRARAFIAMSRMKEFSRVGATDNHWTIGGGYDFGVANIGLVLEDNKYKPTAGDIDGRQWAVSLAVPVGPGKIGASYARAKRLSGGGVAAAAAAGTNDTGAKMWNLGYEWGLSKRTALGFGVAKIDNGANAAFTWSGNTVDRNGVTNALPNAGTDTTNLFVSIRHSF